MNSEQARTAIRQTFTQAFDKARFGNFAVNVLNHLDESKAQAWNNQYVKDAISGEIGKSIIFSVSQNHAAKLTQVLNEMAHRMFPGKYQSDFAVQVTSQVPDAQQFTSTSPTTNCSAPPTSFQPTRPAKPASASPWA